MTAATSTCPDRTSAVPRRGSVRALLRVAFLLLLLLASVPAALLSRPWWGSNLGIVDPGLVFRSAQPTSRLRQWAVEHRLASILNLRGGSPGDWWYAAEVEAARDLGVAFYDLPLGATRRPGRRELLQLIDTLAACKYPLLIHCKSGADRTGLASAIYLMTRRSEPPRSALRAFTLYHSHVPLFGPERLHEPIEEYAAWLEGRSLSHSPERFRAWVRDEYRSPDPCADPPPLTSGPRKARVSPSLGPAPSAAVAHSPAVG